MFRLPQHIEIEGGFVSTTEYFLRTFVSKKLNFDDTIAVLTTTAAANPALLDCLVWNGLHMFLEELEKPDELRMDRTS